ncbi:MAG: hypothetical protein ACYC7A_17410 [Thermoanaerobaculia bacterium]
MHLPIGHALVIPICFWDAKCVTGEPGSDAGDALILMGDWRGEISDARTARDAGTAKHRKRWKHAVDYSG